MTVLGRFGVLDRNGQTTGENGASQMNNDAWLADLQCPLSKTPLVRSGDWLYSTDETTARKYPIRNGIPVLLVDAGVVVSKEEFARVVGDRTEAVDSH